MHYSVRVCRRCVLKNNISERERYRILLRLERKKDFIRVKVSNLKMSKFSIKSTTVLCISSVENCDEILSKKSGENEFFQLL